MPKKPDDCCESDDPKPGPWDDVKDLLEGEDESVVASAKARVLARKIEQRRQEAAEAAGKGGKKKKSSGWL